MSKDTIKYIPPTRSENKSEFIYRLNEEIYFAQARIQEAKRTGNFDEIKQQTRRIELLNDQKI